MKPTPFKDWLGGAFAAFVGGFIEGMPVGSTVGGGMAMADGQAHADLHGRHLVIEIAHLVAVPFFCGLADVRSFQKSCPFPNPFADNLPDPKPVTP